MKLRFLLSVFLVFSLLLPATVTSADHSQLAPILASNPFDTNKVDGHSKTREQLTKLMDRKILDSKVNINKLMDKVDDLPDAARQYHEIDILENFSSLFAVNSKTQQVYSGSDLDTLIANQASLSSLNFYIVHFFSFVGNPDTKDAEYVHTGEVTGCIGIGCSDDYLIQLTLQTSDYRYFGFTNTAGESDIVDVDEEVVLIYPINDTKYYKFNSIAYANERNSIVIAAAQESDSDLLNSYGLKYPLDYQDPDSGIRLYEPTANLSVNQQGRLNSFRDDFIEYYENNFGSPTQFTWDQVEIHHMRPLKYGGSNAMTNGIPLMKAAYSHAIIPKHAYLTRWWTYY